MLTINGWTITGVIPRNLHIEERLFWAIEYGNFNTGFLREITETSGPIRVDKNAKTIEFWNIYGLRFPEWNNVFSIIENPSIDLEDISIQKLIKMNGIHIPFNINHDLLIVEFMCSLKGKS